MAVELKFNSMEDFEPARVAQQVPALAALLETRDKLRDLMSKVDRSEELEGLLEQVLQNENDLKSLSGQLGMQEDGGLIRWPTQQTAPAGRRRHDDRSGAGLLDQVIAATKQTEPDRAQDLVKTLVEQALTGTVTFDRNLTRTFDQAIAAIDAKLSEQLNAIMHHPKFQKLEGTLARAALPGHEQRDQHHAQAPRAQRQQARAVRDLSRRSSSTRASCSRRSTRTSSARPAASRTAR